MATVIEIMGVVQGVGMRPAVARLAARLNVAGSVRNAGGMLQIFLDEITPGALADQFLDELYISKPPLARFDHCIVRAAVHADGERRSEKSDRSFSIVPSAQQGEIWDVPRDMVPCELCLADLHDPGSRFYRYPFVSCCDCGPRMSIIDRLPFDRASTSMADFPMCSDCLLEYSDPENRRFHSQTIACPSCGPVVFLTDSQGVVIESGYTAIARAALELHRGAIIALKGVGGYQIAALAKDDEAISRLREQKHRKRKPFAVMVRSMRDARQLADLTDGESGLLKSAAGPIVLCRRSDLLLISEYVAPGSPMIGMMLPSSPMHDLLLAEVGLPIVATSANVSGEPVLIDDVQAGQLRPLCDFVLSHPRRIARRLDDSVMACFDDTPVTIRAGRGLAPVVLRRPPAGTTEKAEAKWHLGHGGHLKNAVAWASPTVMILGPHIGDLDTAAGRRAAAASAADLARLFALKAASVVRDLHSEYGSTRLAETLSRDLRIPLYSVQHHVAHAYAVIAEKDIALPALAVVWDGTGLGEDGILRGSDFLLVKESGVVRTGSLLPFSLPGGEGAIRHGCRTAIGVLDASIRSMNDGDILENRPPFCGMTPEDVRIVRGLIGSDRTISANGMGRLFDAVASILDIAHDSDFDGEAPMRVQWAAQKGGNIAAYPLQFIQADAEVHLDWRPMIAEMDADRRRGAGAADCALRFHHTMAAWVELQALKAGVANVILTGGSFQNELLVSLCRCRLLANGFHVVVPSLVPPGDGGLALGQAYYGTLRQAGGGGEV